ncbi:hypothetical protein GY14_21290 [Delftia tsuruhatensis]|nr:hypothetical protein GY14_21290 [Delftia tsuruhatensis]
MIRSPPRATDRSASAPWRPPSRMMKKPMITPGNDSGSVSSDSSRPRPVKRWRASAMPITAPISSVARVTASDRASVCSRLCRYSASVSVAK